MHDDSTPSFTHSRPHFCFLPPFPHPFPHPRSLAFAPPPPLSLSQEWSFTPVNERAKKAQADRRAREAKEQEDAASVAAKKERDSRRRGVGDLGLGKVWTGAGFQK